MNHVNHVNGLASVPSSNDMGAKELGSKADDLYQYAESDLLTPDKV